MPATRASARPRASSSSATAKRSSSSDPGMVARRSLITDPLLALGVALEAVTHVALSHHHPDHTMNVALFPNAEVVDFGPAIATTCGSTTMATATTSRRGRSCG